MDGTICYLNTDLYLISADDLTALGALFESPGLVALQLCRRADGLWYGNFETNVGHTEPEPCIKEMVAILEALGEPNRSKWLACTRREFNMGYDCGAEPWAFNQGLSPGLLGRMAAVGASLRWTLYPDRGAAKEASCSPAK